MVQLVVGSVPRGDDYFGQDAVIDILWSRLERDSVLLVAPRRFGKTAAMYRLLDEPRASYRPVYLNVEHISTAADFMVELLAALLRDRHLARTAERLWDGTKDFLDWLRSVPSTLDVGGIKVELREKTDVPANWQSYGDRIMNLLATEGTPLLLLVDEFPNLVNDIAQKSKEDAEHFLRWFRSARLAPETKTRFVVGGSINLVSSLDALGLVETINDLSVVRLRPFEVETAARFVRAVFDTHEVRLRPEVEQRILELVGAAIPYLLAVLLTAIFERRRVTGGEVTAELVDSAFEDDLLGGATSAMFQHYRSRLDRYYTRSEGNAAKAILGTLSRASSPVLGDTLYQVYLHATGSQPGIGSRERLMRLMQKLDNDFYVVSDDSSFAFFSRVLQLWWRRYYGFQEGQ
jgi:hypothetical protein